MASSDKTLPEGEESVPAATASAAGRRTRLAGLLLLAVAAIVPPLALSGYGLDLLSEVWVFAIAAISLDLLMGYGGLVSFGHAAFFGVGAYGAVILSARFGINPWFCLLGGVVLATLAAGLIGAFCVRMGGASFFMLTLAFAQLLYSGAVKWRPLTGGSDGMGGLARPDVLGFDAGDSRVMYLLSLAALTLVFLAAQRLIGSQFGRALIGVRENELRMRALGYRTRRLKLLAFIIAGGFAGLAGGLYAFFDGFVSPDVLSFEMSGSLLLMVVLGGTGTLFGPVIGAAVYLLAKNFVSSHTEHWLLIVGVIFVTCVMVLPNGLYGLLRRGIAADTP